MKPIAIFADYAGMLAAMQQRARDRRIVVGSDNAAHVSGLPHGYVAKLLAPKPIRRVGMLSLGPMLGILGVQLAMVEDPEAIKKFGGRLRKRNENLVRDAVWHVTLTRRLMPKIGRKGGAARMAKLSSQQRSELARKAALARWALSDRGERREGARGGFR
jgi:hypothetical protein